MAYKDSGELPIGQSYQLGEYVFSITVSHDPGESETGINVRCDKGGERARVASEVSGTVESWYVEANDTTADVYVNTTIQAFDFSGLMQLSPGDTQFYRNALPDKTGDSGSGTITNESAENVYLFVLSSTGKYEGAGVSKNRTISRWRWSNGDTGLFTAQYDNNLRVYRWRDDGAVSATPSHWNGAMPVQTEYQLQERSRTEQAQHLVARFAIDLHDAGGTGTDSDWEDPGDWDEDRDPDDPPTKLRLTVVGATAGTHSGTPSSPAPQQTYGSGGNGGNGGGGGAGASTVIVYKFATDRADSKEITATARGPGAGSSGGPGGKGGDGCILIFY